MRRATIASAVHRANHNPGGGSGTNRGQRTKAPAVAPHREVGYCPTGGRDSPCPRARPSPPSVLTEIAHGRVVAPAPSSATYAKVFGVVLRRRWVWSFRHQLRRTLKHSNTEPLLPALPPQNHRLHRKLSSSRSRPLRGQPAPPCALKGFAEAIQNERPASPVGASQSSVKLTIPKAAQRMGMSHLYREKVAKLGISTKNGSHSETQCACRNCGKSNRPKATQCCFAGLELI